MTGLLRHGKRWRRANGFESAFESEMRVLERDWAGRGRPAPTAEQRAEARQIARDFWLARR